MYMYIYIERERERERCIYIYNIYIYIYTYLYISIYYIYRVIHLTFDSRILLFYGFLRQSKSLLKIISELSCPLLVAYQVVLII